MWLTVAQIIRKEEYFSYLVKIVLVIRWQGLGIETYWSCLYTAPVYLAGGCLGQSLNEEDSPKEGTDEAPEREAVRNPGLYPPEGGDAQMSI